ncbi:MAG: EamA family transporter [Flavobacteriaceae bacterium]|nr:EamA family transporter [Flavobacteriaceae bacterium]
MNSKQKRWVYLIILSIIWGSSFILMKKALIDLSPIQVGALRIIFTAITLFIVGFNQISSISKKQWYYIFLTAVLGTFFPAFLFAFAVKNIDSSITSILNSLTPLNTLIIGALFYGFPFLRKQFLGIIIGLFGALFLILKGAEINPDQNYFYALFIVIASVGYAFNVNILKKHLNDLNALAITTGNFLILFFPALIVLWKTDFIHIETIQNTKESLYYLILLSVFGTAMAKTLFNRLVQISSPIFSSSVTYLIPIIAIFWGLLDGEKLHISQLFAGVLILIGVYLTNKGK